MRDDLITATLAQSRRPLDAAFEGFLNLLASGKVRLRAKEFRTDADPLGDEHPRFHFGYSTGERQEQTLDVAWSEPVERELLRRGIAMDSAEEEAARGGTMILAALRYLDLPFGKDFVDTVMWEVVDQKFGTLASIRGLLTQVPHHDAQHSDVYRECRWKIEHMLDGYGASLMELGYSSKAAYPILVAAVYYVIDDRHLISASRSLIDALPLV